MQYMLEADAIIEYIASNPSSSCFASVIPIAGIIGPKATEENRLVSTITLEIIL